MTKLRNSLKHIAGAIVVTVLALLSSNSFAQLRVIVEYDDTEHRVLRVVELPSKSSVPISDHLAAASDQELLPDDAASKVKLLWFNANSELISTDFIDDPRTVHAPLTSVEQSPTMVGLSEGAYVVTGPSDSRVLEIQMPVNIALGRGKQVWRLMLVL